MMSRRRLVSGVAVAALLAAAAVMSAPAVAAAPDVLATIKPIHSLVAGVMEGVGEPGLLIEGAASPHSFSLRPSDARRLQQADVVFWVGGGLETFLRKSLETLAADARAVALAEEAGLIILPAREGGTWEAHGHEAGHDNDAVGHYDTHVWLDPENARRMVAAIAAVLGDADPEHRRAYAANAADLSRELTALEASLREMLRPVKDVPYVVFHDAYHYFEDRFGTDAVGAITVSPGRLPGAGRLYAIREKIVALDARCIFSEPQFEPALVETVRRGTGARTAVLDPLGTALEPGPDAYFQLMRNLASSLADCLSS